MTEGPQKKILIVEDEEIVRIIVNDYLKMANYSSYESETTEEALELIKKEKFDLAIVDINMPGISGEEFMLSAKKISPDIKFLIHTGSDHYKVSENLKKIGLSQEAVLFKPVEDMQVFKTTIENILSKKIKG